MGFSRQKYWSELPFPSPGDLPNPVIKPGSPALLGGFFTTKPSGKPQTAFYPWFNWERSAGLLCSKLRGSEKRRWALCFCHPHKPYSGPLFQGILLLSLPQGPEVSRDISTGWSQWLLLVTSLFYPTAHPPLLIDLTSPLSCNFLFLNAL